MKTYINLDIWNKFKNLIRHSATIKTSNSLFINIIQNGTVWDIQVLWISVFQNDIKVKSSFKGN